MGSSWGMGNSIRVSLLVGALVAAATVGCGRPGAYRAKSLKSVSGLSYSWVRTNLFAPRCFGCHGGAGGAAGIDLSSHAALISSGAVVPFDPAKSRVVLAVESDRMPKGGPAVSDELKVALSTWILAGAPESTTGNEEEPPA
ncbi:MAG TPA: c-type cytochrome domain-containing protein, partial [Bdellovibrionota bacterium]|nr:c-type cytochrome domain-containing protein [Bdellovibrionota bacterium]